MLRANQALLVFLAQSTDCELAKAVQFLKAENEILHARLPKTSHARTSAVGSSSWVSRYGLASRT
jgi:hypothetical protein